jgi:hypothetical protein
MVDTSGKPRKSLVKQKKKRSNDMQEKSISDAKVARDLKVQTMTSTTTTLSQVGQILV